MIDNKDGKTCYFLDPKFREVEKAFDQALLWAYFRVPFFAALVTAVLVTYALYGGILIYRIAAGLGAVLLWIQPNLTEAYKDEADPQKFDEGGGKQASIRFQLGFSARFVAMLVEWRRIALTLHEGARWEKVKGWRFGFWWRWVKRLSLVSAIYYSLFWQFASNIHSLFLQFASIELARIIDPAAVWTIGTILFVCYIATMLFVVYQFVMAKYFRK